jgi:benzoate 4-monooxygenase
VLGHGNGFTKSEFYYAFDNIQSGIFTTRDRAAHSRKRKYVAHMFSPKAMVSFEPFMTSAIGIFVDQMDNLIATGKAARYTAMGETSSEVNSRQQKGEAALDVAQWAAFLAFDIVGDLVSSFPRERDHIVAIDRLIRPLENRLDLLH